MPSVRALARRRQATRLQHAAAARAAFHARGEAAWQQYKRDGVARPLDGVFDRVDARFEARRRQLPAGRREIKWSVGAELAELTKGGTLTFPPAPEPLPWDHPDVLNPRLYGQLDDWEPPRLDLRVEPADLSDEPASPPPPVYADINPPKLNLKKLRALVEKKPKP